MPYFTEYLKAHGSKISSLDFSHNPLKDNGIHTLSIGLAEKGDQPKAKMRSEKTKSEKDIGGDRVKSQVTFKKALGVEYLNLSFTEMSDQGLVILLKKL